MRQAANGGHGQRETTMTKTQIKKAMEAANITGDLTGTGKNWEVELMTETAKNRFMRLVCKAGGYQTGYGAWRLSPDYCSSGDWNDKTSRCHY